MSLSAGLAIEKKALTFLEGQGLRLVASNYRCRMGEIDLIMWDKEVLVFVEVRARNSDLYGGAAASVTPAKQKKLIKTATYYLMTKQLLEKHPARFDVLCAEGTPWTFDWIKNAFTA